MLPISAEHGSGIGDLLDAVFDVLPEPQEMIEEPEVMLTESDEAEEDETGPDFSGRGSSCGEAEVSASCGRMASMRAGRPRSRSSGDRMSARVRF